MPFFIERRTASLTELFRRKTQEELEQSILNVQKGRFKIILGAVSGSGKTYHLLLEGNDLKKKGIDVVVGCMSRSAGPKVQNQANQLEQMPVIEWEKGEEEQCDLDIESILERNPEVVLVDHLAHRNRPEAAYPTRLDEVMMLINKQISIIATINIYELEDIYKLANEFTSMNFTNDECVPKHTLSLADDIKLLDVTPEVILKRLEEETMDQHIKSSLFQKDNLAVLRELSLRVLAGEVNEHLDEYRQKYGLLGASGATERILVSAQYYWNGSLLIRRGDQIAKRLGGELNVVCFRNAGHRLSEEKETFKRSIVQLVEKLGGTFEEKVLKKDDVADEIVEYAIQNNTTRIVMGQSKRSRWEEFWHGSILHKILRATRNIDLFIVADRAEKEGERVLPARQRKIDDNPYRRPSDQEVENRINHIKRGTLKVYIGAAPGVGKTYTMLREANELRQKGIDVVIGLLETHGRRETLEQVGVLETIPRKQIPYKGVTLEEMDTKAILMRNPEVVLIDELAHTNVPGSIRTKRYEDVEKVLKAGISVISTLNIQHIESLNDSVKQITGIRVRETVPDRVLGMADEIELIDISPKALRQRMKEGNIYRADKIEQSLSHFFKTGNLIALREMALREVADDVDERLESWEHTKALRGPWRTEEVICVCIHLGSNSELLIRRGFRIAYRLKADWYVVYVQDHPLNEQEEKAKEHVKKMTKRLGGHFHTSAVSDRRKVVGVLQQYFHEKQATQIIIGHSAKSRMEEIWRGSIVQKLLKETRHLDVLVVAHLYQ